MGNKEFDGHVSLELMEAQVKAMKEYLTILHTRLKALGITFQVL